MISNYNCSWTSNTKLILFAFSEAIVWCSYITPNTINASRSITISQSISLLNLKKIFIMTYRIARINIIVLCCYSSKSWICLWRSKYNFNFFKTIMLICLCYLIKFIRRLSICFEFTNMPIIKKVVFVISIVRFWWWVRIIYHDIIKGRFYFWATSCSFIIKTLT